MCCVDIDQLPHTINTDVDNTGQMLHINDPIIYSLEYQDLAAKNYFQSSILIKFSKRKDTRINDNGNRSVSFLEENLVHEIDSHASYSRQEREKSWYSGKDLLNMRISAQEALSLDISDLTLNSYEMYLRTKARRKVVNHVLELQSTQQKMRHKNKKINMVSGSDEAIPSEEILAGLCNGISGSSEVRAVFHGKLHAKEATEIYKEDGFQISKLSSSKKEIMFYQQTNLNRLRQPVHQQNKTCRRRLSSFSTAVNNVKAILTKRSRKGSK